MAFVNLSVYCKQYISFVSSAVEWYVASLYDCITNDDYLDPKVTLKDVQPTYSNNSVHKLNGQPTTVVHGLQQA